MPPLLPLLKIGGFEQKELGLLNKESFMLELITDRNLQREVVPAKC